MIEFGITGFLVSTGVREGPSGPSWESPGIGHKTVLDTKRGGKRRKGREKKKKEKRK